MSGRTQGTLVDRILRILLPIGILFGGGIGYRYVSVEPEQEKVPPSPPQLLRTQVEELRSCDYPIQIQAQGVVQAQTQVSLNAQVSGIVERLSPKFEVGAFVSQGEVLAEIQQLDYQIAVDTADAKLAGTRANLELATNNYNRSKSLLAQSAISAAELDQLRAQQSLMKAELRTAESQLEKAKFDLKRTVIVAPFDGRITQRAIGRGQAVSTGTTLGVVLATDFAEVRLPLSAKDLPFLDLPETDTDASLEVELLDSLEATGRRWSAKIVRVEGALDQDSLDLFVIARIDDPFGIKTGLPPLRIGQPVIAAIAGKVLPSVIPIPRGAVQQLDQITLVEPSMTLKSMKIVPLWSDKEHVIVREPSLVDGAMIATTQLVYAPDGAKVEIIPKPGNDAVLVSTNVDSGNLANFTTTKGSDAISAKESE